MKVFLLVDKTQEFRISNTTLVSDLQAWTGLL